MIVGTRETPSALGSSSSLPVASEPSPARAWLYLLWHCFQRQAKARQMVWIALALLGFAVTVVAIITAAGGWGMGHYWVRVNAPVLSRGPHGEIIALRGMRVSFNTAAREMRLWPTLGVWPQPAVAIQNAVTMSFEAVLARSGFVVFSNWLVFPVFISFLLPIWSLSFATDTLGGEREAGTLVWLLTRPLPRFAIYLAKFIAVLPWALGLNLGGFALLCLAAGAPGRLAFRLYWPAILCGSIAFCSLFHFMSACFRRPAVVAIVYSFFLETVLGNMPGYMKRVSITFYTRCLMFGPLEPLGISPPEKPSVYLPVPGLEAAWILAGITVVMLVAGMVVFSRAQYQDLT
jgi:ABC-2 type transport system permease protein